MINGFFGDLFDFNHDGHLDAFEQAADFSLFAQIQDAEEKENEDDFDDDEDNDFDDEDEEVF